MKSFAEFELNSQLLRAVEACGFTIPTPIQREAIPVVLTGRDLMASAQTGTGKTAAFVLPALQRLMNPPAAPGKGPRVLVLTPTRELAAQVNEDIARFSRFSRFRSGSVLGGMAYGPQFRLLDQGVDLLVATPGRLMDHMSQGRVNFSRLEIFVLDEADRMLDMGFINDIRKISAAIPGPHQSLLFSATLEGKVGKVAQGLLKNPACIQLATNTVRNSLIRQHMYRADDVKHKHRLLAHHLEDKALTQALIFTATKRKADRLSKALASEGHSSAALHGDMRQAARRRTVEQMRLGKYRLLVATDVAARGLDIKGISHVINFDLPMVAEDYIHRIGRTGRAGETGTAISLVGPEDWERLSGIEKLTGRALERDTVPGMEPLTIEPTGPAPKPGKSRGQRNFSGRNRGFAGGGDRQGNASPRAGGSWGAGATRPSDRRRRSGRPGGPGRMAQAGAR